MDKPRSFWSRPTTNDLGTTGIGKSTFIRTLCEENNIGFIDVRLAQREPVDIRGLPVPRDDKEHRLDRIQNGQELARKILLTKESYYLTRSLRQIAHSRLRLMSSS